MTVSLLVLVVGVFVWIGFAYVVGWTTWVDRRLAGWQRKERVRAVYRRPADRGFLRLLKTVSSDPQSAIGLALAPLALLLARGCATAHAELAARVLSPPPGAASGETYDERGRSHADASPLVGERDLAAKER